VAVEGETKIIMSAIRRNNVRYPKEKYIKLFEPEGVFKKFAKFGPALFELLITF
jgi:hypothetical protein